MNTILFPFIAFVCAATFIFINEQGRLGRSCRYVFMLTGLFYLRLLAEYILKGAK